MDNETEKSLAKSLEAKPEVLPYLPELLTDLWALGSWPDKLVPMLRPLKLAAQKTRLLDLGCGKGAVSVILAREFGFHATGIDASRPFLEEAKIKAKEFNVSHLCRFEFGDIRDYVKTARDFDIVVYASLGGILGNFDEIVARLRNTIRTNGYIVVDDGYLKTSEKIKREGYEHYLPHQETINQLASHGDKIVEEIQLTDEQNREIGYGYLKVIKKRAMEMTTRNPQLKKEINEYISNQEIECGIIDQYLRGAIWLLKKTT
jgi:cyclopropane fatty-acyl-phospholipid synthase-like methyltransferase